ncbi:MAG: hypothetical protein ABII18_10760 [bacterium]|nr:hypothetical protein [bacterium]MBU1918825.1 hypothetical protein [bacterium]
MIKIICLHIIFLFLILLLPFSTKAGFAKLEHITKDNMAKHEINIKVTAVDENSFKYTIKAPMVDDETPAWLIECKTPLKPEEQDFRNYIWLGKRDQNDIIKKTRVNPNKEHILEFTLTKEQALITYLYIDYARPLLDGGYYYTINLNLFRP